MTDVSFSQYNFRTAERDGKTYIFDEVRRKEVPLTPEEWVRQHILHYLLYNKGYSKSLIAVERGIELNGLLKRFDVVVFANDGKPKLIVECKAPEEKLTEKVFEQIARYNLSLRVDFLWVTNGQTNFCCRLKNGIEMLAQVPGPEEISKV